MYICKKNTYMQIEKIINTAYSFGAAVVVFGAWAKIEHKDYSDNALTVGLLVETGIFCIYGLLEWRREPDGVREAHAGPVRPQMNMDPTTGVGTSPDEVGELTETMKQTNRILSKVFRAGE
jgi:hypothetical protein